MEVSIGGQGNGGRSGEAGVEVMPKLAKGASSWLRVLPSTLQSFPSFLDPLTHLLKGAG